MRLVSGLFLSGLAVIGSCRIANAASPEVGAVTDLSGVWWSKSPDLALRPVDGSELPFTAAGKAAYEKRQANLKSGAEVDRAVLHCVPEGVPRVMATPYPFQIVQTPGQITLIYESNHTFRPILLDAKHPEDMDPTYMGNSIAHWEKGTLVIDTIGLNDETMIDATGLPHSDKLHVTERLRKIGNGARLEALITIEDPEIFKKPWVAKRVYELRNDIRIGEFVCNEPHRDLSAAQAPPKFPPRSTSDHGSANPVPDFSGIWYHLGRMRTGEQPTLKPWAAAIQKEFIDADAAGKPLPNNTTNCYPSGMPHLMNEPYPFQMLQTPTQIIILAMADHQVRYIYLNETHPADLKPTWYGHSIGHYEGDTLVVSTRGINNKSELSTRHEPHTGELHVTERYRLIDDGKTLEIHMEIDDPGALEKPYAYINTSKKVSSIKRIEEYVCAQNNKDGQIPTAK